jgi:hypothetical protein
VIGRTSSFQFKGKSDDLRAIGQRLYAALVRLMNEYYDWPTVVALAHAARGEPDQAI